MSGARQRTGLWWVGSLVVVERYREGVKQRMKMMNAQARTRPWLKDFFKSIDEAKAQ